jgi:hypothetical protein
MSMAPRSINVAQKSFSCLNVIFMAVTAQAECRPTWSLGMPSLQFLIELPDVEHGGRDLEYNLENSSYILN